MAHITLSVPDNVYREMKKHPEIKWSEIARESIVRKLMLEKKVMHASELRLLVNTDINISEERARKLFKKQVKEEWKDLKKIQKAYKKHA